MVRGVSEASWLEIDEFVEAYEFAWNGADAPEIADFLPERNHPRCLDILLELIRVDLELRWEHDCPRPLDTYSATYPECFNNATALNHIAFEEYRARRRAGELITPQDYAQQYGIETTDWPVFQVPNRLRSPLFSKTQLAAEPIGPTTAIPGTFPKLGTEFAGFYLQSELGRGAFSRVYLARQADLANRLVVLKVSTETFAEAEKLAQLQHTYIVPIYSVHRIEPFSAVCMPYFGATTLADLIRESKADQTPLTAKLAAAKFPASRKPISRPDLNETIPEKTRSTRRMQATGATDELASEAPASDRHVKPAASTDNKIIPGPDHVEAVLRIAVKLAEGLSHAHSRGILHRDLKPANVLLSDDGQPMLLDFNLAADTKIQSLDRQAIIGGTLPYMAPEQLTAFRDSIPQSDPRSDLFSLGMILYEMLTGSLPYPAMQGTSEALLNDMLWHRQQPLPRLLRAGSAVTPAIESIVQRCLAADVQQRYQTADQLQEDLQRQLTHRPLRYAPEPSLSERLRKWMRRHPRLTSASSIAVVSACLLTSLIGVYQARTERLAQLEAVESLTQFQNDLQDIQVRCLDAGRSGPMEIAAVKLAGEGALDRFQIRGESPWQKSPVVLRLSNSQQNKLTHAVSELLFLLSVLSQREAVTTSGVSEAVGKLQEALEWNERAIACFPPDKISLAFAVQREALTRQIQGTSDSAKLPLNAFHSNLPLSARDACMLACLQEGQQRFREALPLWKQATTLEPQNIWAWYGLGHCHARLSQPQDSVACFTACIILRPEAADWYFHRGIANLELRDYHQATADFSSALERQPDNLDALINRGISELRQNDTLVAIGDFAKAIREGKKDGRVFFMLAQALDKAGEIPAAAHARQRGFSHEPTDEIGWIARGVALVASDPQAAICDFDRALEINPHSLPALESKAHVLAEKLSQSAEAVKVLDRAVAGHPKAAAIIASRGVLFARLGERDSAVRDAEQALGIDPSQRIQFQVAGIYALTSRQRTADRTRAVALLTSAFRGGLELAQVDADHDLDSIRDDPQFQQIVQAVRTLNPVVP